MSEYNFQDFEKPEGLVGETVVSCEVVPTENYRTSTNYLLLTFQSGKRQLFGVHGFSFYRPQPTIEEMRKARKFFTVSDITKQLEREETKARADADAEQRRYQVEYDRLGKLLGLDK